jgi:hypothetical protein
MRQWAELGDYDRQRYHELRFFFRQQQKDLMRDRRVAPFSGELATILSYVDHAPAGRDKRCIVCGIACGGPVICVNAQQLKHLIGRCKSSINSGFQQLGYEVMRDRAAGRDAIFAIIPELRADPGAIRQWTVRCANDGCQLCFCSAFTPPGLPPIHAGRAPARPPPAPPAIPQVTIELPTPTLRFDFGFGAIESDGELAVPDLPISLSVDALSGLDGPGGAADVFGELFEEKEKDGNQAIPRSHSGIMAPRFS